MKRPSLLATITIYLLSRMWMVAQFDTNSDLTHIDVYITPFYNSEGPSITVGPFSSGLTSTNETSFVATIREMRREWSKLSFVEMYVAAIRLYDLGYRKESIYWFYSAQYRGRLFAALLDEKKLGTIGDPGFELMHANGAFHQLAGPYINSYAFADTDQLCKIIQRVKKEGEQLPDMKGVYPGDIFKAESEWPRRNREMEEGLEKLASTINRQKDEIERKRAESGIQAQVAKLTDKKFPDLSGKDAAAITYRLKHLRKQEDEGNLDSAEQDRKDLVKLGCFEQRDLLLRRRLLTTNNVPEFVQMVTNSTFINYNYALRINFTNAYVIAVTAHRGDIPAWEGLVSRFDSAKMK